MAIWPFRRRSKRNKNGPGGAKEKTSLVSTQDPALNRELTYGTHPSRTMSRKLSKGKKVAKAAKGKDVDNDPEKDAYAYSPVLAEKFPLPPGRNQHSTSDKIFKSHVLNDPHTRMTSDNRGGSPAYYRNQPSHSSFSLDAKGNWQHPPTLKGKRSATYDAQLNRQHSKKKKTDYARFQEIRPMPGPLAAPHRAFTHSGLPTSRESNRKHGGFHTFNPQYRSASETSVSFPESMHSSLSLNSERGFIVKSLDLFTPRPRLRYTDSTNRYKENATPSRSGSRRERQRTPISDEVIKKSKTIDELADDLDSGGLRELMERDQRRREKKRRLDAERADRKLQRKAERQKAEEEEEQRRREQGRDEEHQNLHRGPLGREEVGLGIGQAITHDESQPPSKSPHTTRLYPSPSPVSWLRDGSNEDLPIQKLDDGPTSPGEELEEAELGTAQAVRLSMASLSPPPSLARIDRPVSTSSGFTDVRRSSILEAPEATDTSRRESGTSQKQYSPSRWASFFRRSGGTKSKKSTLESTKSADHEFSTSRDSIPRQTPPPLLDRNIRRKSGPPVRTMSKFREDLPELPVSPPESWVQSPSASNAPGSGHGSFVGRAGGSSSLHRDSPSRSAENFTVVKRANQTQDPFADPGSKPTSFTGRMSPPEERAPSAALSQSLASIDSEGSWLSGKPSKRVSLPLSSPMRTSGTSIPKRYNDFSDSAEELGLEEDEYFSRLSPGPEQRNSAALRESGVAIASSDDGEDGDGDARMRDVDDDVDADGDSPTDPSERPGVEWRGVVSRHPTVVHREARVKSREGLLNDFQKGAGTPESASPIAAEEESPQFDYPTPDEMPEVQRATSVDLARRHARHMSAGSAKLLDVVPRRSSDHKRMVSQ